ncbi:hypothetical protein WMY93_021026 [Mugilogobius chulae]|uniref:L1 transposable element RRM domain-containing protein n=1 Tax=Mugilogobius chulae TaxID=88201 RepID=A0AAW0NDT3_9GOBI
MSGDKSKKCRHGLQNNSDREKEKEVSANKEANLAPKQHGDHTLNTNMIGAVKKVLETELVAFRADLKKDWEDFRFEICEEIRRQTGELAKELNQELKETNARVAMGHWRGEHPRTAAAGQRVLQEKVSDLEGRARRNNIRLYGVPEDTEGTSMAAFVENLIKRELGGDLTVEGSLGIERAHRALGPKPPAGAPPRSVVVRFLQFTTKEEILRAAWKKTVCINDKRVYFGHDYAVEVQRKRKEYIPIKKALKEKGIRFQTPLNKMRVFYASGSVLYNSAAQAAEDLQKRGVVTEQLQVATARNNMTQTITEESLTQLIPWETQTTRRADFLKNICEKLKEFRRQDSDE